MKSYKIEFTELGVTPELVLNELGYGNVTPDAYVTDTLMDLFARVQKEVRAECLYTSVQGELLGDELTVGSTVLKPGFTINSILKNSESFALFVGTAGYAFERIMNEVKAENDMIKTYLADTIGSLIAERTGDIMEKHLEAEIGAGHTNRLSPGYCGWHLSEQTKLLALMGGNPCGITLSEVCLMTPVKSISGIIGIGANVDRKQYACNVCELETCYKRKRMMAI